MRRAVIIAFVLGLAALAFPASAQESFDCGDEISESVRLTRSLANCKGDGLVVGASDITIDLGGNTIDGDGSGTGILNETGHRDVVVTNGVITGFDEGILIDSPKTTRNRFDDLELFGNDVAIAIEGGADSNVVSDNEIHGNDDGITIVGSLNHVFGNEIFDERPAVDVEGDSNTVEDNEIEYSTAMSDGTALVFEGDLNVAADNELLAGPTGIDMFGEKNLIDGNELEGGGGEGIVLEGDSNDVTNNEVEAYEGVGIILLDGSENLIESNEVGESGSEGIVVEADETRIESNESDDNGSHGIEVDADDVRIDENSADDNGTATKAYGILAEGEGIEGAGNDADGNSNTKECAPAVLCA